MMLEAAAEIDARESAASVKQELLRLVVLLREVQPIKRRSVWPIEVILHLAERQGWICPECGSDFRLNDGSHHIDHVIPWSLGGGNELANIQILHADCNLRKGARADVDDVIRYLQGRILNL